MRNITNCVYFAFYYYVITVFSNHLIQSVFIGNFKNSQTNDTYIHQDK